VQCRPQQIEEVERLVRPEHAGDGHRRAEPLLYLEHKAYLQAIREAISGVELARVVLVRTCSRIEAEGDSREPRRLG
jgi:hypothetical protein